MQRFDPCFAPPTQHPVVAAQNLSPNCLPSRHTRCNIALHYPLMNKQTLILLGALLLTFSCRNGSDKHRYTNALAAESSPYLLQHAHNPVNWYPWGEKARNLAKKSGKLMLVSIGYASCHWCHVMEKECFTDTAVARIMNDHFVCVKVDREERPDIDQLFMTACQLSAGDGCGWPLNAIALSDGKPVWTGTYFPKASWMERLNFFAREWETNPDAMRAHAEKIEAGIRTSDLFPTPTSKIGPTSEKMDRLAANLLQNLDPRSGGRKGSPRFPMPSIPKFLLEYSALKKSEPARKAAEIQLDKMLQGGIFDHLGGGFARYATDGQWKIPHFEKMLYDNAQLIGLYSKAYQLTKKEAYKNAVVQTIEFVRRDLTGPDGSFYASIDADYDGEEGRYYTWTYEQFTQAAGGKNMPPFLPAFFGVEPAGNWEGNLNILQQPIDATTLASQLQIPVEKMRETIQNTKNKLLLTRNKRKKPATDDKAITAWNALMTENLVTAYKALGHPDFLKMALKNAGQLKKNRVQPDFSLKRNFKNGIASVSGFLDDYAATIAAFTAIYEVTFDETWLETAKNLTEYALKHFKLENTSLLAYTPDSEPVLITRKVETADQAIPSSNAIMAHNLFIIGNYFYRDDWVKLSEKMLRTITESEEVINQPDYYANWCRLYLLHTTPFFEIAILGPEADLRRNEIMTHFLPNAILLGGNSPTKLELLNNKLVEGKTLIYVCGNKVCKAPVDNSENAITQCLETN